MHLLEFRFAPRIRDLKDTMLYVPKNGQDYGPVFHAVGAASAWVNVHAAFDIYLLTPLFFITPPEPQASRGSRL